MSHCPPLLAGSIRVAETIEEEEEEGRKVESFPRQSCTSLWPLLTVFSPTGKKGRERGEKKAGRRRRKGHLETAFFLLRCRSHRPSEPREGPRR